MSDEDELVLRAEIHSFLAKTGDRIGAARAQGKYPVQSLFSIPHEGRWSWPHFGSETAESRGVRAPFQNDYREANPPAYSTCEMVCVGGFKRCIFSYPDSFVSGCARKPQETASESLAVPRDLYACRSESPVDQTPLHFEMDLCILV